MKNSNTYIAVHDKLDQQIQHLPLKCCSNTQLEYCINTNHLIKDLENSWLKIIDWSMDLGNSHFLVTVSNTPYKHNNAYNCTGNEFNNLFNFYNEFRYRVYINFPTTTWILITPIESKDGFINFQAIVAIRNFVDYDYTLKKNLKVSILESVGFYFYQDKETHLDVVVKLLKFHEDVEGCVRHMHKDIFTWRYPGELRALAIYNQKIFRNRVGDIYYTGIEMLDNIDTDIVRIKLLDEERFNNFSLNYKQSLLTTNHLKILNDYINTLSIVDTFNGTRVLINTINHNTILCLVQYYILFKGYYICGNCVYIKIIDSKIGYKLIGYVVDILCKQFQENVVNFYIKQFFNYFNGFNFSYLLNTYWVSSRQTIISINEFTTNKIILDYSVIEFSDGIYFIKLNKFYPHKDQFDFKFYGNIATIKYYNITYTQYRYKFIYKVLYWISWYGR